MQLIAIIIQIVEYVLLIYFGLASIYIFIYSFAGLFYKKRSYLNQDKLKKIAILIPGYKEDTVIIEVAKSALQQNYPLNLFDVIVIADSFRLETIKELKSLSVKLIEVHFNKSTKAKSLNKAME